ncbi:hypothetical protein GCM10027444_34670 [Actinopolyspora lacussalsi]
MARQPKRSPAWPGSQLGHAAFCRVALVRRDAASLAPTNGPVTRTTIRKALRRNRVRDFVWEWQFRHLFAAKRR